MTKDLPVGKFDGVDTIPMFDIESTPKPKRQPGPRSVAFGNCPVCTAMRVGLVPSGRHLVWRTHTYRTWSGAMIPCPTTGVTLCDDPAPIDPMNPTTAPPTCPCTS